ncbi:MAG: cytochrome P450 [Planctomycetaceae bacterium]|nr:cytochrome P450 [Planctomycetaceae bacterium]
MGTASKTLKLEREMPPGPRGGLLLGNTLDYVKDPLGFLERSAKTYGDVVKLRLGNLRIYLLVHPEHIEYVLRTHNEIFIKDRMTQTISPVVGQGLLTSEGDYWKRQRRLAQPTFQHQQIKRYAQQMVEQTGLMLDGWTGEEERDLHADLSSLTLAIVARTLFDTDVSHDARTVGDSLRIMMDYSFAPMNWFWIREVLPLPSSRAYWRAIRRIDEIIYRMIEVRRGSDYDHDDLLSRLLHASEEDGGGSLTDRQVRDEAVTIFLAGHETTALALFYSFYLLANHPAVEQKLVTELESVLGGRLPTAEDVARLTYCEWILREAMRLYPPVWAIGREPLQDCEIGGYRVPRGTQLFLVQYLVHHDPRWYENPDVFRPERWDGDLARRLPRCAYFPFGDGPRTCLGNHFAMMEGILVLATIAQRYRLSLVPGQTLELFPSITLRPRHSLFFRPRSCETTTSQTP